MTDRSFLGREPSRPATYAHTLRRIGQAAALLSMVAGGWLVGVYADSPTATAAATAAPPVVAPNTGDRPFSFAELVARVSPAVVSIQVDQQSRRMSQLPDMQGPFNQNPFGEFFRRFPQEPQPARAAGAGFIIEPDGYIVTNNHVVEDATRIRVNLSDGRELQARVVGADSDTDVALLKVDGVTNLPTVAFGDDTRLRVGDWVVAVGNPYGLGGTVTAGIVSSIGRDIGNGPYTDYIQIDAPINRGNSGGPTFDLSGRVVGMNTAIYSPSGGSVGIGFATPASTVRAVVDQLKANGSVARGWLGLQIQSVTADMASSMGLSGAQGAIVAGVVEGSPAARAGFRQGDVVLSINGTNVSDSRDLTRRVGTLRPGERTNFTIWREGARHVLAAVIERREAERVTGSLQSPGPAGGNRVAALGLTLMPLNGALRQQYEIPDAVTGVVVTAIDPSSEAAEKGIAPGSVIARVGRTAVQLPSDVERGIAEARNAGRDHALFLVVNGNSELFVALRIAPAQG